MRAGEHQLDHRHAFVRVQANRNPRPSSPRSKSRPGAGVTAILRAKPPSASSAALSMTSRQMWVGSVVRCTCPAVPDRLQALGARARKIRRGFAHRWHSVKTAPPRLGGGKNKYPADRRMRMSVSGAPQRAGLGRDGGPNPGAGPALSKNLASSPSARAQTSRFEFNHRVHRRPIGVPAPGVELRVIGGAWQTSLSRPVSRNKTRFASGRDSCRATHGESSAWHVVAQPVAGASQNLTWCGDRPTSSMSSRYMAASGLSPGLMPPLRKLPRVLAHPALPQNTSLRALQG